MKRNAFKVMPVFLALSFILPAYADKITVVPAHEAHKENFQVKTRLGWHTSLDAARQEAARAGKLVFWVHMLGTIDGKT